MTTVDRAVVAGGRAGLSATSCVRIRDLVGDVVGSGFLVGPGLVATCAHVVAEALRTGMSDPAAPREPLLLDFPVLGRDGGERSARVLRWVPVAADGRGDVALLRLDPAEPDGVLMPPVRGAARTWDHRFRVFGFPEGQDDGVWSTGRVRGAQGTGWLQLQGDPGDHPIVGGFSGSPVWDESTGAVIGMTVAADRDPGVTTAYLIPIADVLGLDPELLPCPYRGLEPFGEEHADVFFGRDPELRRLRDALRDGPLVAVAGPSGTGKSSLVNAGLVPALLAQGVPVARVRPEPPEAAPAALAAAVLELADPAAAPARRQRDAARIGELLARRAGRDEGIAELGDAVAAADPARLVLVLDQFEELVETALDAARLLLEILAGLAAATSTGALRTVLTIRARSLDDVLTPELAGVLGSGTVLVGPLDRARLREVVLRPAERAPGLDFEDGLVDRIVADAADDPGQLPLVQSLLARLWHQRVGGTLTVAAYDAAGGVGGALAANAERAVAAAVFGEPAERALDDLLTRLVAVGRDGHPVRRPVRYLDLPDPARALVAPLAAHRLLVLTGHGEASTVEPAHQSLTEHWPRLRERVEADRDFLAWRTELDGARVRWRGAERDDGALLRGAALRNAARWDTRRAELTADEAGFLDRSRERHRRDERRRRLVVGLLGAAVLAAVAVTVIAVRGQARTDAAQAAANAGVLARSAQDRAPTDPTLASELALAGWRSDPSNDAARSAVAGRYAATAAADRLLTTAPAGDRLAVVGSGAGESATLLTIAAGRDGAVRLSLLRDPLGAHPAPRDLSADGTYTGALTGDDGHWTALTRRDGGIDLVDLTAPPDRPPTVLVPPGTRTGSVRFTPDGTRLGWVTLEPDGHRQAHQHDLRDGRSRPLPITFPPTATAGSLHLFDDPDLAAVRTERDGPVTLRSVATGAAVRTFGADAEVFINRAPVALTCTRSGSDSAVATDVLTGATRAIPLADGATCGSAWVSTEGRFLLTHDSADAGRQRWRAVELATGRTVQFVTPWLNAAPWPHLSTEAITLVDGPGGPVALVAAGSGVLRIPTVAELPPGSAPETIRYLTPDGTLIGIDRRSFTSVDPATGRVLARRDRPGDPATRWQVDQDLWVLDRPPGGRWQLTALRPADLTARAVLTLPGGAAPAGRRGVDAAVIEGPDGAAAGVVGLDGGVLSAWDPRTGRPLGAPVRLAGTPADASWFAEHAVLLPRHGHPGQVLVGTPGRRLQLWDVPAGRRLADLPVYSTDSATLSASGDRLAVLTPLGTVEFWDLRTGRQVADGVPLPGAESLVGFTADGTLVATGSGRIVLYDPQRRAVTATIPVDSTAGTRVRGDRLMLAGVRGAMPETLSTDPDVWRDRVCAVAPGEPSAAATALYPRGVDPDPPCS